jgi:hypothetical protein
MGTRTDADIAAWQEHCGIKPAYGERAEIMEALSQACFEAIKIIELTRCGICQGDGHWTGGDGVSCAMEDIIDQYKRLREFNQRQADADPPRAPDPPKTRDEHLRRIAADMFNSETRRGWLVNGCSWIGRDVDPNISEQEYIELFIERDRDRDLGELEEMAGDARPSNMPTAFEREMAEHDVPL